MVNMGIVIALSKFESQNNNDHELQARNKV